MAQIFRIHGASYKPDDLPAIDLTLGIGMLFDQTVPFTPEGTARQEARRRIETAIATADDNYIVSLFAAFANDDLRIEAAGRLILPAVEARRVKLVALMAETFQDIGPLRSKPLREAYNLALETATLGAARLADDMRIVKILGARIPQLTKDSRLHEDTTVLLQGGSSDETKMRLLKISLQIAAGANPASTMFGPAETVARLARHRAMTASADLETALTYGRYMAAWAEIG